MSDITFMKGYGFPRGSRMDYAGYGVLVNSRRQFRAPLMPTMPEPGIFAKIPALDGMDEGGSFGTEYTFTEGEDIDAGPVYGPEYHPELMQSQGGNASGVLWGLGALAALWFFTR